MLCEDVLPHPHITFKELKNQPTLSRKLTLVSVRHTEDFHLKTMTLISLLITVLIATDLVKGVMECNVTKPTETQQCFGALGEPLILHLPVDKTIQTTLKKGTQFSLRFNGISQKDMNAETVRSKNPFTQLDNGTLRIDQTTKNDAGVYQLEVHSSSDGKFLQKTNINLKILAAVTQPAVSHRCLSAEQMTVSCSAEGDEVNLTLSLDNNTLIHSRPESTESQSLTEITIRLHGQLVGKLVCDVQNNVSRKQTDVQVTGCGSRAGGSHNHNWLVTLAVKSSLIALFLLAVFLIFICCKLRAPKPTKMDVVVFVES
ncbi:T-cell surface antigen CD2-like isoform 2-T2 [Menidia menidia]